MTIEREPSCEDPSDPELLPVDVALARVAEKLTPLVGSHHLSGKAGSSPTASNIESVALVDALDRILASDVESPIDVPSYVNSAMDGYAIRATDIPQEGESSLKVAGTIWAGKPLSEPVDPGCAARIMTGGMMPEGLDTVVIQEHVRAEGDLVVIDSDVEAGRNVRQAGEDVQQGQTVVEAGTRIDPAHLGLLASLGVSEVSVVRRLRVAYFTTGDELRSLKDHAGTSLGPGELFDSNRYTLFGMLSRLNVEILDLGVVRDNPEDTRSAFHRAAADADVILTSGGVSAGEADFVTKIFHEIGDVSFWKLAMRPGRPLAFGTVGDAVFFGLPGNPVAVMVTFYEFVEPALRRLMGETETRPLQIPARCLSTLRKSPGRTEYQRGVLGRNTDGELTVSSTGKQGAGRLSSMTAADCIIVLEPGKDRVIPGDMVEVQPFRGLV